MIEIYVFQKRKYRFLFGCLTLLFIVLACRLFYLMVISSEELSKKALDVEQRERSIKAARGVIYDRNGVVLADNQPVCTISVINSQVTEPEKVIKLLSEKLDMDEEEIRQKVEKISSREKIKSNVPKEILGLESKYDSVLKGTDGTILTLTDFQGIEIESAAEERVEPVQGDSLYLSLDYTMQSFAQQAAEKVLKEKQAKSVSVILMNPQNGEIYAMVNVPEYDLNEPYELLSVYDSGEGSENDKLNNMWRNPLISDSYEPGSTFKIVTATAALEEGKVSLDDTFHCPGYKIVEDRKIRCHKTQGHGTETFKEGVMNSCNPVFMEIGARVGAETMLEYYKKLGLYEKTGVDLPGEAGSIMHKLENIGAVELATMSFGQSIQITPLQLLRAVSAVVNGGKLVTPHFAIRTEDSVTKEITEFTYETVEGRVTEKTSETMCSLLEAVVSEGTGKNAQVEGYQVGGKTATSEKLPRGTGKYISSFLGFAPADHPEIMGLVLIDEPTGVYYGGTIAAPVMAEIFQNILPYLDNI